MSDNPNYATETASSMINAELARQGQMWDFGDTSNPNTLYTGRQLQMAATAQLVALCEKHSQIENGQTSDPGNFEGELAPYWPEDWSGMRDYGSDVANLVVAGAWIQREIARLIAAGADTTRTPRDSATQPYAPGSEPRATEL